MITTETIRKFAPGTKIPEVHAQALEAARRNSSVNTARRLCHFMGQIFVETGGLAHMIENLNYKNPQRLDAIFKSVRGIEDAKALIARGQVAIGNRVYANRLGNGNEASGDGFLYRGSGYKQLTGRANYRDIGRSVGIDLERDPELARRPAEAAKVAFAFWDARGCSALADTGDLDEITKRINGPAKLGLAERRMATFKAMRIWK
jgi:putative chitinase